MCWIVAFKYVSLPSCIVPSLEECLGNWSLTRDSLPLSNKDVRSSLIALDKFKSWRRGLNISGQCCRIIAGDTCTLRQVNFSQPMSDELFYAQFDSCDSITAELYDNYYVSEEERSFPLAYVLLVHTNPAALMRFLKAVYRKHNAYCIHYDGKSSFKFKSFVRKLSECIENILIPKKIENVIWGDVSILNAQLNSLRELQNYHSSVPWRYAFSLQGHELPLRTNREMVEMLQSQPENMSIVESWPILDDVDMHRVTYQARLITVPGTKINVVSLSSQKLAPFSLTHKIELYKSWCFIAVTPSFVQYSLDSELSKNLLNFLQNVSNAEEFFYATLYNYKLTPGGRYKGDTGHDDSYDPPFAVSVCLWLHGVVDQKKYCGGLYYHSYCVFGVKDLKSIFSLYVNGKVNYPFPVNNFGYGLSPAFVGGTKKSFFLNRYMTDTDPTLMDCLEERLSIQNMLEYYHDHDV